MGTFKENLRNELDFQGLTVKELSSRTGIIKGTLDNYLSTRASIPPADIAVKIAKALNVSVEFLVTGKKTSSLSDRTSATFIDSLKKDEKIMIQDFHSIPQNIQETFRTLIHQTAENLKK